jgi:hypothetical protein
MCRSQRLLALRRAVQNLAYAVREEGDWAAADGLLVTERPAEVPGGHTLATGYSQEAMPAYWTGDWDRMLEAAEALRRTPNGEWDMQTRGVCAAVRLLRDEPVGCAEPDEIAEILAAGRRSGFHRIEWGALAHVALCRALQRRGAEAVALLTELSESWRSVRAVACGEWIGAAAFTAALCGRAASIMMRDTLAEVPHRTPWVEAAARTVAAGVASADGDHARAASMHLAAAGIYAEIPSVSDRMMSLAGAVRALRLAGDGDRIEPARAEVAAFATRVRSPRLLEIAGIDIPEPAAP